MNYTLLYKLYGRFYNPLGIWNGWYFSEEIKYAESLGYNIIVHYGYKFDKTDNVFTNFVNKFYAIKSNKNEISMDRTTAKWLLNSLYGRLGMRQHNDNIAIVNNIEAESILSKYQLHDLREKFIERVPMFDTKLQNLV
uniref:DNA polymerase n=1 Tax=Polyozellus multiplex TaxID=281719 RepID=UPI001F131E27|nr:DNA polymerase [Polyozellus multiplex]UMI33310.1 DNA polymerase [Polyozellus multiplex]